MECSIFFLLWVRTREDFGCKKRPTRYKKIRKRERERGFAHLLFIIHFYNLLIGGKKKRAERENAKQDNETTRKELSVLIEEKQKLEKKNHELKEVFFFFEFIL